MAIDSDRLIIDEVDEFDENDKDIQIHMYVDGNKAYLLEDEELDSLSRVKNELYDNLGEIYDKEETLGKVSSTVNGLFLGTLAMVDFGVLTDAFTGNPAFSCASLGLLGATVIGKVVMWRKNKKMKSDISDLENNYEIAKKAYEAKNEQVASNLINNEKAHNKAYM